MIDIASESHEDASELDEVIKASKDSYKGDKGFRIAINDYMKALDNLATETGYAVKGGDEDGFFLEEIATGKTYRMKYLRNYGIYSLQPGEVKDDK